MSFKSKLRMLTVGWSCRRAYSCTVRCVPNKSKKWCSRWISRSWHTCCEWWGWRRRTGSLESLRADASSPAPRVARMCVNRATAAIEESRRCRVGNGVGHWRRTRQPPDKTPIWRLDSL